MCCTTFFDIVTFFGPSSNSYNILLIFTNFQKAYWPAFTKEVESILSPLTNQASPAPPTFPSERTFRTAIITAANHHIPKGNINNFSPGLSSDTLDLISQCDTLRSSNPTDPLILNLNHQINQSIDQNKRRKWLSHLSTFDHKTNPHKLWNTIKGLNQPKHRDPNSSITILNKKICHKDKDIARALNYELTSVNPSTPDKVARVLSRSTR